jgi:hypothetical protein
VLEWAGLELPVRAFVLKFPDGQFQCSTAYLTGLTVIAKSKKFESMVINLELVGFFEFFFQFMNGTLIKDDRPTAMNTGKMVLILLNGTVEGFSCG